MSQAFTIVVLACLGAVWHILRGTLGPLSILHVIAKTTSPGQAGLDRLLRIRFDAQGHYRLLSGYNLMMAMLSGAVIGAVLMAFVPDYFVPLLRTIE